MIKETTGLGPVDDEKWMDRLVDGSRLINNSQLD